MGIHYVILMELIYWIYFRMLFACENKGQEGKQGDQLEAIQLMMVWAMMEPEMMKSSGQS